nr:alpha/beta fold hydrolase [Ramlibacter albus]
MRGLARESGHWCGFGERLRERLPMGDAVLEIDLPGNGRMHRYRSPTSIAEMVEAARAQASMARPPYMLVAISLGGMVAAQWLAAYPDEVAGCVLVNSSFRGVSPFWQRLRPSTWSVLTSLAAPGLSAAELEERVLSLTSNCELDPRVLRTWIECSRLRPVTRMNFLRQLWAAARFRLPPGIPRRKVLILASERDRLVSSACSRALARVWEAPLHIHSHAGHDLAIDDPDWLLHHLLVFGEGVTQPPCNFHDRVTGHAHSTAEATGATGAPR